MWIKKHSRAGSARQQTSDAECFTAKILSNSHQWSTRDRCEQVKFAPGPKLAHTGKQQTGQQPSRLGFSRCIPLPVLASLAIRSLGQNLIANSLQFLTTLTQQQLIHTCKACETGAATVKDSACTIRGCCARACKYPRICKSKSFSKESIGKSRPWMDGEFHVSLSAVGNIEFR